MSNVLDADDKVSLVKRGYVNTHVQFLYGYIPNHILFGHTTSDAKVREFRSDILSDHDTINVLLGCHGLPTKFCEIVLSTVQKS